MPPNFALQPVLDYRHNLVEALEIEFGQISAYQNEVEDQLKMIFKAEEHLLDALNKGQVGDIDLVHLDQLQCQLQNVEKMKEQTQELLNEVRQQVEEKRQELMRAKQDEEVLEILKEKEIQRFQEQEYRSDLQLQDDIYISQAYQARIS